MKKFLIISMVIGFALMNATPAKAIVMTFEEFLGSNGVPLSTFYSGVTFTHAGSAQEWVAGDATTGLYNVKSSPSGQEWGGAWFWMNDYVFAWTEVSGYDGKIIFDNADATFVQLNYSSSSTLNLDAYDASNILLDSVSGPANLHPPNDIGPGTLLVNAPLGQYISYVLVYDTGNQWCIDNVSTDATGIIITPIPAPGAILLGSIGVGLVGWLRRRRTL